MPYKRGSRWVAKTSIEGQQVHCGTFDTRREAKEAEAKARLERRGAARTTVAGFVERWLRDFKRPRASTNRTNRYAVERFNSEFGRRRLAAIDRLEARAWAQKHRSAARAVRAMYADAIDAGLVRENPFANLRLEQSRGRRDLTVLTAVEVEELADTALEVHGEEYGAEFRAQVLFAAYVGLRPAELFVLERADLDFEGHEVRIRQSLGSTGEITLPKNGKPRTVVLPPPAADAVRSFPRRVDHPWLFASKTGKRLTKTSHAYLWREVRSSAARRTMDFYELRHFCATYLLEQGLSPADVAVQLGHTDGGRLVMELYGHPSEALARERIKQAFQPKVRELRVAKAGERKAGGA